MTPRVYHYPLPSPLCQFSTFCSCSPGFCRQSKDTKRLQCNPPLPTEHGLLMGGYWLIQPPDYQG
ncbi:hypothetical protein BDW62DRAFT_183761 [Aspergillus aurantiobrunneus]